MLCCRAMVATCRSRASSSSLAEPPLLACCDDASRWSLSAGLGSSSGIRRCSFLPVVASGYWRYRLSVERWGLRISTRSIPPHLTKVLRPTRSPAHEPYTDPGTRASCIEIRELDIGP